MTAMNRIADVAHKTIVTGLFSFTCFQLYEIQKNVRLGLAGGREEEHPQKAYLDVLRDKASEEYKKYYKTDHRDWYAKDDDSYLKDAPKANNRK